jgi:acyl-CoA thioesterase FadM
MALDRSQVFRRMETGMNLYMRLIWVILTWRARGRVGLLEASRISFRVMPHDLDVLGHVNNGRFLSILDLGRVDAMLRSGLATKLRERGWYPVVAAATIQFRKSMTLFQKFDVETQVLGWDSRAFFVIQRFLRGGEVVAQAAIRARFRKKPGRTVEPADILVLAGYGAPSPALPEWVAQWNEALLAMDRVRRADQQA